MGAFVRRSSPTYRETLAYLLHPFSENNVFMSRFYEGSVKRATDFGYHPEIIWLKEKTSSFSRLEKMFRMRNIRGLIIGPTVSQPHGHIRLTWSRYAVAAVGSSLWKPRINRVQHHHYMAMILALRKIRKQGGKRIGFIISSLMNARTQGTYVASFLANQTGVIADLASQVHRYTNWEERRFLTWLKQTKPDVVICSFLDEARWIHDHFKRGRFRLVCLDVATETPEFAGIDQHYDILGSHTVDLVLSELQRREFGLPDHPQTIMIEGSWRDGLSFPSA